MIKQIAKRFGSLAKYNGTSDATAVFVESVSSTVKGISSINYIEEFNNDLSSEQQATMKRILVYRSNPADSNDQPKYMSYYVDLSKMSPMYLDALTYIKDNMDSTLSYRRSCREGICGSCAMNCDGLHSLACLKPVDPDLTKPAIVTPLGHMFVLKDLVVDMTNFYTQYKFIEPFLKRKTEKVEG
jgi:succinate dehydrogenase (ubiquinone) iron-sulfur subunit